MKTLLRAVALATVFAMIPAAAFAATDTHNTTESLVVEGAGSITITGVVPTTVNLGTLHQGDTGAVVPLNDNLAVLPVNISNFEVTISQSDLTGPGTIPATDMSYVLDVGFGSNPTFAGDSAVAFPAANTPVVIRTGTNSVVNWGLALQLTVPASAPVGSYSGTLTMSATGS